MTLFKRYDGFMLLARQFGLLLEKGQTHEQAMQTIEKALDYKDSRELSALKELLSPTADKTNIIGILGPAATLRKLLEFASKSNADKLKLFSAFYKKFLRYDDAQHLKNFDTSNLIFYLVALLSILTIVTSIYVIYVFPGFEDLYNGTNNELPGLTRMVMTSMETLGVPILGGLILVLSFLVYVIKKSKSNLLRLNYFSNSITWLPGFKTIAITFNDYLALNFLSILMESGVSEQKAIDEVRLMLNTASAKTNISLLGDQSKDLLQEPVSFANSIGNFKEEVEYQIFDKREIAIEEYNWFKDTMGTIAMVVVASIVGTLIVAMYLPIFQMGKIIGG